MRRSFLVLGLTLFFQGLTMAPVADPSFLGRSAYAAALPDPPARPTMPRDVRASQPDVNDELVGRSGNAANHVTKLTSSEVADLNRSGISVVVNEESHIEIDITDGGQRTRFALWDTKTESGLDVIGLGFLDQAGIKAAEAASAVRDSGRSSFGPQSVLAHNAPYDHTHPLGPPFHSCSYLYMYAGNSRDAFVYICPVDVTSIRYVGSAMAALLGVFGMPLLGVLGVLIWNIGVSLFQQNDGSIKIYVPGSSSTSHYGWTYHYSRYSYWNDWYWYYNSGSPFYCYAQKYSNGYRYYACNR